MGITDAISILIATVVNIALGMIWYSLKFLGTPWARAQGFEATELQETPWHYVGATLLSLITSAVFYILLKWLDLFSWEESLKLGFYIWLGFIATSLFSAVLWSQKSLIVYFIDISYYLLSLLLLGSVFTLLRYVF